MKRKLLLLITSLLLSSCTITNNSSTQTKESTQDLTDIIQDESSEEISSVATSSTDEIINYRPEVKDISGVLRKEIRASYNFFYDNISTTKNGYGLISDRFNLTSNKRGTFNSIASIGFGFALYPVAVEYGWISQEAAKERVEKTLDTLANCPRVHGFYYHFMDDNGSRYDDGVEVSIIDTAIMMCGALVAGKYFGGTIETKANSLYEDVEWNWYYDDASSRFYMGYSPERGFFGSWGPYAEQLMIFVLAAGSPKYHVGKAPYTVMKSISKKAVATSNYGPFYLTHTGSLFTYQFSHAFIDLNKEDEAGINWFTNSVNASKAAVAYAISMSSKYKTLSENSWGITASDGPNGYTGAYGSRPSGGDNLCDGTVAPCAALGSLPFTPVESTRAAEYFLTIPQLWSKYGFIDAFNLGEQDGYDDPSINIQGAGWFDSDVIGIDKGITALMIENYRSGMIWNISNNISYIKNGLEVLGIK